MSTTVDERIVSMQFDNKHFESNVQTSMSTLQKLKQALRLDGAAKGLETVQSAASKVNMAPLGAAVEGVKVKFDALGIMATTTLMNITNDAVNAGKRIANALTIEPIKSGFSEYELKMNSMQTIVSSTGESVETVNKYLNELNEYSDKTIYSFADMTQNIGKFTNAGVKLEDAVAAIQGISNEAALSGANANEASRAMYNFAQALSAGHVKLIDWKSIENANMATVGFKEELIKTALEVGTLTEAGEGMYQTLEGNALSATSNFNETLQDQWMTSDVLIKTLKKYSSENTEVGKAAFEAATKVRTFSQMMDTLKESAQSGWATTWELIFGSLEESKSLWTGISDVVGGFIQKINDARNNVLRIALTMTSPFSTLADKISKVTGATETMTKSTEELGDVVNQVIRGEWGRGQERWDKLTAAGYDWAQVQNIVNERLGSSVRHTSNLADAQKDSNKVQAENIEQLIKKTDAQLKEIGFTQTEIDMLRNLQKQSEKTGIPIEDLIKDMDQLSGRTLLLNGFKNIGKSLANVFRSIADAWKEIFPPKSTEEKAQSLYNLIAAFHNLTTKMPKLYDENNKLTETGDKLVRTFKGLFALVDIFTTITGGVLKTVLKTICKLLGMADIDILSFTARIGDAIVKVRDWIDAHNILAWAIQKMIPYLKMAAKWFAEWFNKLKESGVFTKVASAIKKVAIAFKDWVVSLKDSKVFKTVVSYVKKMAGAFKEWIAGMKEADNIPKYIIQGLVKGLKSGVKAVLQAITYLVKSLINKARDLLGIHSPSKEFQSIGEYIIDGLVNGIKKGISAVSEVVGFLVDKIIHIFDKIDWGSILTTAAIAGAMFIAYKIVAIAGTILSPLGALGQLFTSTSDFLVEAGKSLSKVASAMAFEIRMEGLKKLATTLLILVASLAILSFLDLSEAWKGLLVIGILMGMLVGLAAIMSKLTPTVASINKEGANFSSGGMKGIFGIGLALLAMAGVVKILGDMGDYELNVGLGALTVLVVELGVFMAAYGKLVKGKSAESMHKAGKMMRSLAITLLLMVGVMKLCSMMEPGDFVNGTVCMGIFTIFAGMLILAGKTAKGETITKFGGTLIAISIALLLLLKVVEIANGMFLEDFVNAAVMMAGVFLFMKGLASVMTINKKEQAIIKLGGTILAIAASMLLLVLVAKICASMTIEEFAAGVGGVLAFGALALAIIFVSRILGTIGKGSGSMALTIMGIAVAIGAMAAVAVLISLVDWEQLKIGLAAMGILTVFLMALMAAASLVPSGIEKTMLNLGITLAILAASLAILSFIKPEKLVMPMLAMVALMAMLALVVAATKYATDAAKTLLALSVAVAIMGGVLYLLGEMPWQNTLGAAGGLSILMLSMAAVLRIISGMNVDIQNSLKAIGLLALLAVPLYLFVGALALMSKVQNAIQNAIALGVLMLAMSAAVVILSKVAPMMAGAVTAIGQILLLAGAMVLMGIALNALVPVITTLGSMDFWTVAQGLIVMAGAIAIIGVAGTLLGPIAGQLLLLAVGIGVFGVALNLLVPPLQSLGSMSLAEICTALLALAGALAVIGVAALVLTPVLPAIIGLSVAIAAFGIGALAAGVGITMLASGLIALATGAATIVPGLTALVTGLLPLIPVVIAAIGNAILLLMQQIMTLAPVIATTIATVILTILTTIATYLPNIIQAGMDIIMAILTGIKNNIGQITTTAIEIMVNFINAIASKIGAVVEAGVNLILSFIEGLTSSLQRNKARIETAVRNLFETLIEIAISVVIGGISGIFSAAVKLIGGLIKGIGSCLAKVGTAVWDLVKKGAEKISDGYKKFKEAAGDMIDGLVKGIGEGITKACNAVKDLAEKAKDKFCDIFDINSPSRVMFQYGKYIDEGLANGLKKYTSGVVKASANVGNESLDSMRSIFSQISDVVNTDVDSQPTIRPVLDLSNIRSGAGAIGGLFANPSLGVSANIGSISSMMSRRQNGTNDDIVSAINDLKSTIGNASGDSYTINGITYSEGSDVAEAIKTLTRAAKVGRRV